MPDIALFDAKNRLSELIDRLQGGEVFTITRRGKPVASLGLPGAVDTGAQAQAAVAQLRASRQGVSLGGLSSQDLRTEGRR